MAKELYNNGTVAVCSVDGVRNIEEVLEVVNDGDNVVIGYIVGFPDGYHVLYNNEHAYICDADSGYSDIFRTASITRIKNTTVNMQHDDLVNTMTDEEKEVYDKLVGVIITEDMHNPDRANKIINVSEIIDKGRGRMLHYPLEVLHHITGIKYQYCLLDAYIGDVDSIVGDNVKILINGVKIDAFPTEDNIGFSGVVGYAINDSLDQYDLAWIMIFKDSDDVVNCIVSRLTNMVSSAPSNNIEYLMRAVERATGLEDMIWWSETHSDGLMEISEYIDVDGNTTDIKFEAIVAYDDLINEFGFNPKDKIVKEFK